MIRALSLAFGLLMVAAGAVQADGPALVASAIGLAAVLTGVLIRSVATLAVVATVLALALSEPSPAIVAIAGLGAAAYLVLRHARGGGDAVTVPTMLGAVGLTVVAMLGAAIPLGLPWIPLVAPLAVIVVYAMVLGRFAS